MLRQPTAPRRALLFATISLAAQLALPAGPAADAGSGRVEPIVAAQLHALAGATWAEVDAELGRLRRSGFNTIFFRVFQNEGDRYHGPAAGAAAGGELGVYFETDWAPVVADMLPALAGLCRRHGLRLFAWMTTRRMDWLDSRDGWRDRRYNPASDRTEELGHFDLLNDEFAEYMLGLYADLASQPIDGVLLQDDFVIKTFEGFTPAGLAGYRELHGAEPRPRDLFQQVYREDDGRLHIGRLGSEHERWCRYKSDRLLALGSRIIAACRGADVDIVIALNVYYDTVLDPQWGLAWLGQDLEGLGGSDFDLVCLMSYHRQIAAELGIDVTEAIALNADLVARMYGLFGERLLVKLQAADWRTGELVGGEELERAARAVESSVRHWAVAPGESTVGLLIGNLLRERAGAGGPR